MKPCCNILVVNLLKYSLCDLGGQLFRFCNNSNYSYLDSVKYDRFGAKTSQKYGNGLKTSYTYNNLTRRLSNITTINGNSQVSSFAYTYDNVGNVTQVTSSCPWLQNQTFTETFTYDASDQLTTASETQNRSYSLSVSYDNWGKVENYDILYTDLLNSTTTQDNRMFSYPSDPSGLQAAQTLFAPEQCAGTADVAFTFGINGSLRKREVSNPQPYTEYYLFNSAANMKAYSNNGLDVAYYGYNASNTRTYKLSFLNQNQWVNGQPEPIHLQLQSAMFYPNAYLNFNHNGEYTKHYYNGAERIASRLGITATPVSVTANARLSSRSTQLDNRFQEDILDLMPEGVSASYSGGVNVSSLQSPTGTSDIFYYHTNHLGSTAFVTDQSQTVTQGFLYAPFGEITTEFNATFGNDIIPKYSFNAKELDEETGMYYYEARYYKPPVFTSRDAIFEKKPWLSPYHYCSNNPVGRVDPSGYDDDWYQSEDGTVGWTEGHAATVVDVNGKRYRNIGETYSKQNADGSYSNYYQNVGFKSNKKFNAKEYILKNDLVGKYISNNSPLSVSSKKELFQASIHHAQDVFIRYSVEGTANICNGLGTALSGAGMVTAAVPGVQVAAGGMVGCGSVLSSVGTGINCLLNIVDGDYRQAAVNATSLAVGFGTTKLWKSLNITTNQTIFLRGKSDVQNSTITDIINSGMGKKQKQ